MKVWIAHEEGRSLLGDVPASVTVDVLATVDDPLPGDPAEVEFWVPPYLSKQPGTVLVPKLTSLRVVQLMSAGADVWVGKLPESVTLCDAQGVHSSSTSEWAAAAILAYLRAFPAFVRDQAERRWNAIAHVPTDELAGKRVLIVGAGAIGEALAARLEPFEVSLTRVARTARPGTHAVEELPDLLPEADVVVLLVPLTEQTRGLVDAAFLGRMRDGALLVNSARGPVVDTEALVRELATGRIGAALDVTDPEPLPADHPLWTMPNVLITPHVAGAVGGILRRAYKLAGDQIRRYVAGAPLINVVHDGY